MQAAHGRELESTLAAMQPDRHAELAAGARGAPEQGFGAGFDPVGRQHGADQPAGAALEGPAEADGLLQAGKAARLVEVKLDGALRVT